MNNTQNDTVLSHNSAIENIMDVLQNVDSAYLVEIYNKICSDRIESLGDSLYSVSIIN